MDAPASIIEHLRARHPAGLIVLSSDLWPLLHSINVTREWKLPHPQRESASSVGRIAHCSLQGTSLLLTRAVHAGERRAASSYMLLAFDIAREFEVHQCVLVGTADLLPPETSDIGVVTDHVNLFGGNPLIQCERRDSRNRFPDMTNIYSDTLQEKLTSGLGSLSQHKVLRGILVGVGEKTELSRKQIDVLKRMGRCFVCSELVYEAIAAHSDGMDIACALHLGAVSESSIATGVETVLPEILSKIVQILFP